MSLEFDDRDRESVVRDLRAADEDVRRLAVERLEALPAGEAIEALIGCLGDASWRVRKTAVERLVARRETDEVSQALVCALADGDNPGRRNAAVEALVHCGSRAVPRLLEARTSEDADVRKLVVDALAGIGDPRAREGLLDMFDDPDPNVRAATADALGAIGGDAVPPALLRAATNADEDQLVRFSAIHALEALEHRVAAAELANVLDDPVLGPAGLRLLGREGDEHDAVAVLLKAMTSKSRSRREASIRSLLRIIAGVEPELGERLVEQMREAAVSADRVIGSAIERLPQADLAMRLTLVQFLGLVGAQAAVIPILLAGRDEALAQVSLKTLESLGSVAEEIIDAQWPELDSTSRRDACVLFGGTSGEGGAVRLLSSLEDPISEVRTAAARSIGIRKLGSGLPPLVQRLAATASDDDFESEEELMAVTDGLISLARPGEGTDPEITARAVELLSGSLDGSSEDVRLAVATVLGRIGRHEDAQIVELLLRDPSDQVRRASVEALARLDPGTAAEPLRLALADESPTVRIAAANALGASESEEVIDDLARLADDEDSRVRSSAVRSLILRFAGSDDPDHREKALAILDRALDDEAPVALSAVEALCEVGGPEAARATTVMTRTEPEVLREAIRCVATHGDQGAIESLLPLIGHPDWSVRAEAIQTVADRGWIRGVPAILRRLETEQDDFVRSVTLRALKRLESEVG